jgi:hypothetical protein
MVFALDERGVPAEASLLLLGQGAVPVDPDPADASVDLGATEPADGSLVPQPTLGPEAHNDPDHDGHDHPAARGDG